MNELEKAIDLIKEGVPSNAFFRKNHKRIMAKDIYDLYFDYGTKRHFQLAYIENERYQQNSDSHIINLDEECLTQWQTVA